MSLARTGSKISTPLVLRASQRRLRKPSIGERRNGRTSAKSWIDWQRPRQICRSLMRNRLPISLRRSDFFYTEDLDFAETDSESVDAIVRRLTDAAFIFNLLAITEFGGRSGRERELGLVSLKIAAAFHSWDGEDLYSDPFDKAAALLDGIVHGHPFEDGNKRTGFLITYFYFGESRLSSGWRFSRGGSC